MMKMALQWLILSLVTIAYCQTFNLIESYKGLDFFNKGFTLYEGFDPTFGYVDYVGLTDAQQNGLINMSEVTTTGMARWGVDTVSKLDPKANLGRKSIRLQSVKTYTHGLFILDVAHLPANICGTWPAFWLVGTGVWPDTGEMDIIEQTNNQPYNIMSLHSSAEPNCTVSGVGQTGQLQTPDCAHANSYIGCTVKSDRLSGAALNAAGGGVFAMLWTSQGMQMWTFQRDSIPQSIGNYSTAPVLSDFGPPVANFQGSCDFDAHFHDQQMIFNIDFCGTNAGENFQTNGCPLATSKSWESCNIYVANNPQAFVESYWEVNYLDVYEIVGDVSTPTAAPTNGMTSYAAAVWPASWTTPAPFASTKLSLTSA